MTYSTLLLPHFTYGIELWGTALNSILHPLELVQKRAVRCCTKSNFLAHTSSLFDELKALKIRELYIQRATQLVYKNINIENFLGFEIAEQKRFTRSTSKLLVKLPSVNNQNLYSKQNFLFAAPRLFNELPEDIKNSINEKQFKNKLFVFLLANIIDVSGLLCLKHL